MSPMKGDARNQGERDSRQKEEEVPKAERHSNSVMPLPRSEGG